MRFSKKYKIRNPYKPDELLTQEVQIGTELFYDYATCPWVAIDSEFLNLDINYDKLCLIQLASPGPDNSVQIELVWVWERLNTDSALDPVKQQLASLLARTDVEIIMHVSSADLPRMERFSGGKLQGKLFDTKVAGKITLRNINSHGLNDLVTLLIDPRFTKDKQVTGSQWDTNPERWDDRTFEYAMNDVLYLHALKLSLTEIAERRGVLADVNTALEVMPAFTRLLAAGYDERILSY